MTTTTATKGVNGQREAVRGSGSAAHGVITGRDGLSGPGEGQGPLGPAEPPGNGDACSRMENGKRDVRLAKRSETGHEREPHGSNRRRTKGFAAGGYGKKRPGLAGAEGRRFRGQR